MLMSEGDTAINGFSFGRLAAFDNIILDKTLPSIDVFPNETLLSKDDGGNETLPAMSDLCGRDK